MAVKPATTVAAKAASMAIVHLEVRRSAPMVATVVAHPMCVRQGRRWVDWSADWLERCLASDAPLSAQIDQVAAAYRAELAKHPLRDEDWALLSTDIDLNAQGIVVAADRRRRAASA